MLPSTTELRIIGVLNRIGIPVTTEQLNANLKNDLALDSTEFIEVVAVLEKEFGVKLPESPRKQDLRVCDLAGLVMSAMEVANA